MPNLEDRLKNQDQSDSRFRFLDSQEKVRQSIFDRRQKWIAKIPGEKKKAQLFELEMLLLGVHRFLDESKNMPLVNQHIMTKDFTQEIGVLRDSLVKIRKISHALLIQGDPTIAFRQFVGEKIVNDRILKLNIDEKIEQVQPEDALYVLYSSFQSYQVLLEQMMKKPPVDFSVLEHIGILIAREMRTNLYFSPQQFEQFTPLYDRITSESILEFIRSIRNENLKKIVSIVLLVLFRVLNYLKFVPRPCLDLSGLRKAVIILSLVSTEIKNLVLYINEDLLRQKEVSPQDHREFRERTKLLGVLEKIAVGLQSEHSRVFLHELVGLDEKGVSPQERSHSVELSYHILKNICEYHVMDCVQVFNSEIDGKSIFNDFVSPRERSKKLHDDLLIFGKIIDHFFEAIKGKTEDRIGPYFRSILEFGAYFRSVEFQSLRLQEYAFFKEFTDFSREFSEKVSRKEAGPRDANEFKEFLSNLKPFVKKTAEQVAKRSELKKDLTSEDHIQKIFFEFIDRFK